MITRILMVSIYTRMILFVFLIIKINKEKIRFNYLKFYMLDLIYVRKNVFYINNLYKHL